ncbi:MAG: hypothetical protein MJ117_10160, partial [Lachnospiraceae bacterium]|nr:hypothetical protein [Lachnospiraceae bacterium]
YGGHCLLTKIYEEAKYNAAFECCVNVLTMLIQKYGSQVLEKQEESSHAAESIGADRNHETVSEKSR